jgi:uncharacterized membrane protein (DUF373 family)
MLRPARLPQRRSGGAMPEEANEGAKRAEGAAGRWFLVAVDLVVKLLMPLAVVALLMGIARAFLDLWNVWRGPSLGAAFDVLVTDILSMFVVIELLKSIFEYFEVHRLRITFILDAALVFVLREVMIGLYKDAMRAPKLLALALLVLALGAVRIAAVRFSPERRGARAP